MTREATSPGLTSPGLAWTRRRDALEAYFDRTALANWARMTSDAPLGRIRASVRAGREAMRDTLLSWLPEDLAGRTLLDAGCGTGALAVAAARRGAAVRAVDLAPRLLELARDRAPHGLALDFVAGDMLACDGRFDHVVAMDSLIHYRQAEFVRALETLAAQAERSVLVTFAPRTVLLAAMHAAGRLFPRGERAPAIEPMRERRLRRALAAALPGWRIGRTRRVASGFYVSQALELVRA